MGLSRSLMKNVKECECKKIYTEKVIIYQFLNYVKANKFSEPYGNVK